MYFQELNVYKVGPSMTPPPQKKAHDPVWEPMTYMKDTVLEVTNQIQNLPDGFWPKTQQSLRIMDF